jgi:hypothetical protein
MRASPAHPVVQGACHMRNLRGSPPNGSCSGEASGRAGWQALRTSSWTWSGQSPWALTSTASLRTRWHSPEPARRGVARAGRRSPEGAGAGGDAGWSLLDTSAGSPAWEPGTPSWASPSGCDTPVLISGNSVTPSGLAVFPSRTRCPGPASPPGARPTLFSVFKTWVSPLPGLGMAVLPGPPHGLGVVEAPGRVTVQRLAKEGDQAVTHRRVEVLGLQVELGGWAGGRGRTARRPTSGRPASRPPSRRG